MRGSHDPAQVPDRRSPSFGAYSVSANDFFRKAYAWRRRPSVRHSGGVMRPAPNIRGRHQWKPDERQTCASPTFHRASPGPKLAGIPSKGVGFGT